MAALLAVIAGSALDYGLRRRHRTDAKAKARWLQATCRRGLRALAVRMETQGVPAHGAVIVANHLSYLDILVLAAQTPLVFVSKREVRGWPLFGWFAEKAGTRFIDRNRRGDVARIGEELEPLIAEGLAVVLFLEGTTTDGSRVLPFKASLLEPAVRHAWNVVPVALDYEVPAECSAACEVCWWGDMTLAPHLWNFTTLPWVRACVAWGQPFPALGERKAFAETLRSDVMRLRRKIIPTVR